jgi:hypothetical protein
MAKSKLATFKARRQIKAKKNPSEAKELAINVVAGFGGYAATRLFSRIAYSQSVKRWPNASKHVHFLSSILGAAGVYFGSKYWKKADDYHEAATIGAGIAVLQAGIQNYLPKFGWVVSDVAIDQYGAKKGKELPTADLTSILPANPQGEIGPAPTGDFDLDEFLSANDGIEAVAIGQAPPVESEGNDDGLFNPGVFSNDDNLENYNGLMN